MDRSCLAAPTAKRRTYILLELKGCERDVMNEGCRLRGVRGAECGLNRCLPSCACRSLGIDSLSVKGEEGVNKLLLQTYRYSDESMMVEGGDGSER